MANEAIARERSPRHRGPNLRQRLWARVIAPTLDGRLAAGEDPSRDLLLSCRAAQLMSRRSRRGIVQGLERALAPPPQRAAFSSAVAANHQAVDVARPALEQLAEALYSRDGIQARGVVLTQRLLTDPCSALYHPAEPHELHEAARQALLALLPDPTAPPRWERTTRSRARTGRVESARRSRSPL